MNNNSSKQILLSVIGVAILVVAVVGVSFAFFSYVYNSDKTNTVATGTIIFQASDSGLELTNVFPTKVGHGDFEKNSEIATVSISGSTSYEKGIDFTVRAVEVTNNDTDAVPVIPTVTVTPKAIDGVVSFAEGYTTAKEYGPRTAAFDNGVISKGTIAPGTGLAGLEEILSIEVYYDMDDYHISENDNATLASAGLLAADYVTKGGKIIKPSVWNALTATDDEGNVTTPAYSFKIQVTAVEGASADPRFEVQP